MGEGGFGRVYAGFRKMDNLPVAIKQIAKSKVPAWGWVSVSACVSVVLECVQAVRSGEI